MSHGGWAGAAGGIGRRARLWCALVCSTVVAAAGMVVVGPAAPAAAASATLSLYKAIENLATGASEGDRGKWDVQAVSTATGDTITTNGLNGFQTRVIPSGTYRISELDTGRTPPGYRFRDWNCGGTVYTDPAPTIMLADGQNLTCTVTNVAVQSTLTLVKVVEGGSAPASSWTLQALDGPTGVGGAANTPPVTNQPVRIGTYRLAESGGPAGGSYTAGPWVCVWTDHLGNSGTLPVDGTNHVTIDLDRAVTCTITNSSSSPQLTLVKQVVSPSGAAAPATAWTLSATPSGGGSVIAGATGSPAVSHVAADPDVDYTLAESGPAGYTSSGWSCVAASGTIDSFTGTVVNLGGDADVTCTVTNTFTGGRLTLVKQVVDSTQPATSWTLSATGTSGDATGTTVQGVTGASAVTSVPVPAGDYTLAEDGPGGYTTDGYVCNGAAPGYAVSVVAGEDVTCTIVNAREGTLTQLTLVKQVDNSGGGPFPATAWGLRAQGPSTISGRTGLSTVTYAIVLPGHYVLSEGPAIADPNGDFARYEPAGWSCTDGSGAGLPVTGAGADEVDIAQGSQVTCVVSNEWTGSTISFTKQVVNSPFGSHAPGEWTLAIEPAEGGAPLYVGAGDGAISREPIDPGTYRLVEVSGPAGYEGPFFSCLGDGDADADPSDDLVTIPPSADVVCTATNRSISPTLTLVKALDNAGGGTATVADFTLKARGPGNAAISGPSGDPSVTGVILPPGDYVFSEDGPPGYAATWECTGGSSWDGTTAVLDVGQDMVCTATNAVVRPTLTLVKQVAGGPAATGDWQLTADGPGAPITGTTGDPAITDATVDAGVYDLSEAPTADAVAAGTTVGYSSGAWSCDAGVLAGSEVTLAAGEDATCTVTNTWTGGTLTLVKQVDDGQVTPGGGAVVSDWTLTADGPTTVSGPGGSPALVARAVPPGDYDLSEALTGGASVDPDYRAGEWSCTGTGFSFARGAPGAGTLTIQSGVDADVTCTLVNLFQPPHLTLVKTVVGGGPLPAPDDWTLSFAGTASGSGVTGDAAVTGVAVGSGDYALAEAPDDPGAAAGYDAGAWTCTGGTVDDHGDGTADLTLATDDLDVVCTIVNTWTGGTLTLVKQVDDGGETSSPAGTPDDWTLTAAGPTLVSGAGGSATIVDQLVLPGTYDLSEALTGSADGDYRPGDWTCTGPGGTFTPGARGEGVLTIAAGAGADVTCTLVNLLLPPHLTLVKTVTGGPLADLADWTLTAAGPVTVSAPADDPVLVDHAVGGGTFALSEAPTDPGASTAGYTTTGWSCDGGTLAPGATPGEGQLVLSADDDLSVTCTITNTWTGGTLTLVKQVDDGSNGPGNDPGSWTLSATGTGDAAGTTVSGPGGSPQLVSQLVPAGDYDLAEAVTAGDAPTDGADYRAADWVCAGGDLTTGPAGTATGTVSVASGADVTCTEVNRFLPPHLTLVKTVTGGGPAPTPADWPLTYANTTSTRTGTGATGDPQVTDAAVGSGTVTLAETPRAGYTAGTWTCTGATNAPVATGDGTAQIDLTLDDIAVTCTIANTWTGAQLTLVKQVDDGQLTPTTPGRPNDWTLTALSIGDRLDVAGSGTGFVGTGSYALSEAPNTAVDPGYRPGSWTCTGTGFSLTTDAPALGVLDLAPQAVVTCVLTNLFDPPHLTLTKTVTGGPLPSTADWTLQYVQQGNLGPGGSGRTGDPDITGVAVGPGTYTLSERPTNPAAPTAGYTTTGWTCDATNPVVVNPDGTATLTLVPDDLDVTCTIANVWQGGTLTLVKHVDGGTAAPGDWTLTASGDAGTVRGTTGQPAVTGAPVLAGTYALSESPDAPGAPLDQYAPGTWVCTGGTQAGGSVVVGIGDDVTCTVTNTYDPPTLTLVKRVVGGAARPQAWTLTAGGPTPISAVSGDARVTAAAVEPGTYLLSEGPVAGEPTGGYVSDGWTCRGAPVGADGETVVLAVGDDVTCTVTNRAVTVPPPTPPGAGSACPDCSGALASTGTDLRRPLAAGLVALVLGTAALLWGNRRSAFASGRRSRPGRGGGR